MTTRRDATDKTLPNGVVVKAALTANERTLREQQYNLLWGDDRVGVGELNKLTRAEALRNWPAAEVNDYFGNEG